MKMLRSSLLGRDAQAYLIFVNNVSRPRRETGNLLQLRTDKQHTVLQDRG